MQDLYFAKIDLVDKDGVRFKRGDLLGVKRSYDSINFIWDGRVRGLFPASVMAHVVTLDDILNPIFRAMRGKD